MILVQMAVWLWFSFKGGNLKDKQFLWFTVGMLSGQIAGTIDSYQNLAWKALAIQVYFFVSTGFAGIQRFRGMRRSV
jgi:hypothetical protein